MIQKVRTFGKTHPKIYILGIMHERMCTALANDRKKQKWMLNS